MPDLIAQGKKPEQNWRKALSSATVILGRTEKCDWETPWDDTISRRHAASSSRPMRNRLISLVPAPMSYSFASRRKRSTGHSLV